MINLKSSLKKMKLLLSSEVAKLRKTKKIQGNSIIKKVLVMEQVSRVIEVFHMQFRTFYNLKLHKNTDGAKRYISGECKNSKTKPF